MIANEYGGVGGMRIGRGKNSKKTCPGANCPI
jgi:hypothetical protein